MVVYIGSNPVVDLDYFEKGRRHTLKCISTNRFRSACIIFWAFAFLEAEGKCYRDRVCNLVSK